MSFQIPGCRARNSFVDLQENVVTFKRSHLYAALIPLAFVVGLSVGFLFWGRSGGAAPVSAAAASGAENPTTSSAPQPAGETGAVPVEEDIPRYDIPVDDDPALGPEGAPITIVEFSDYECPFCSKFHLETFGRLLDAYPDQIRFVYRDFPLAELHGNATAAAESANCANEQGEFWAYHDRLFSNIGSLNRPTYVGYAETLGLDVAAFEECIDSARYAEEVQADFIFARNLGVRSTPTFFINGLPLVGAQPFEVFQQVIDRELAGEIP